MTVPEHAGLGWPEDPGTAVCAVPGPGPPCGQMPPLRLGLPTGHSELGGAPTLTPQAGRSAKARALGLDPPSPTPALCLFLWAVSLVGRHNANF